ncbi:MAG: YqgE/AlgH family protein [Capnocytophaga sp.]|nr:YqgE/AlgH family protein [Capnocytophaga sp.]
MKTIYRGNILIAEPSIMGDVLFSRSVIFLTDYSQEGAVGFILNKPSNLFLDAFFEDIPNLFRVYYGGPVQEDNLYFIHQRPDIISNSQKISNGVYWGGDFDEVIRNIQAKKLAVNDIKFFLGYSGWNSQQLADELTMNAWVVSNNIAPHQVFLSTRTSFWKEKIKSLGNEYLMWVNSPDDPQMN